MADSFKTLADLVTLNDSRNAPRDISDILNAAPVLRILPAFAAPETTHYYTKYTTAPTVGFRAVGDGRENSKSADTQVTVTLKILDASFAVDKALADAYRNGGAEGYIAKEAMRHLQQALFIAERQFFYGTVAAGDSAGFAGLGNESDLNSAADSNVVNAGGSTADTGSSAWLIRAAGDLNGVGVITGNGGRIDVSETVVQRLAGSSTGSYPAYWTPVTGWMGVQRGGKYDVVRIANLTADSGKGLTDARIAAALQLFPAGQGPTHIVCNRRSLGQLQASRTATNITGAPAPFPADAFGVPIIVTDSIVSTEALLS